MTVQYLLEELQILIAHQPQAADYLVELVPHGNHPRQRLATIHQHKVTVLLEARK